MDNMGSNSNPGRITLGILRVYGCQCCAGGYVGKLQRQRRKAFIRGWESVPSRKGLATFPGSKITIKTKIQ